MVDDHPRDGEKPLYGLLKNLKNSKFLKVAPHGHLKPNVFFVESVSTIVCKKIIVLHFLLGGDHP